jgi:hypothetical protein
MGIRKNNRRILDGDGEWTYRCSLCREFKTREHFHSDNSKPPFNLAYNCKECRRDAQERAPILLDWEEEQGYITLQRLGYDITQDIHQQFIDKINKRYGVSVA